jgi:DNA-binding MarR family transcriptional regulator
VQYGIQIGVFPFLHALWVEDGLAVTELAASVGRRGPTTVAALKQMDRDRSDDKDKRRSYVHRTAKGRTLYSQAIPETESHIREVLRDFLFRTRSI